MQDVKAAVNLLSEQQIMMDTLLSQKQITGVYNTFACECSSDKLRTAMLDILQDDHCIQANIFKEMQTRGWYVTETAPAAKIKQAKQKATSAS
ncbi:MAG: spore coat protein [Oscillospiraceae bacterium]|jgi:spore coat protein CotF|nr:spore coat protein [Oscillospiraceae bacterium]